MISGKRVSRAAIADLPVQPVTHATAAIVYDPKTGQPTAVSPGLKRSMLKDIRRQRYLRRYARHAPPRYIRAKVRRANRQTPGPTLKNTRYKTPFDIRWLKAVVLGP